MLFFNSGHGGVQGGSLPSRSESRRKPSLHIFQASESAKVEALKLHKIVPSELHYPRGGKEFLSLSSLTEGLAPPQLDCVVPMLARFFSAAGTVQLL